MDLAHIYRTEPSGQACMVLVALPGYIAWSLNPARPNTLDGGQLDIGHGNPPPQIPLTNVSPHGMSTHLPLPNATTYAPPTRTSYPNGGSSMSWSFPIEGTCFRSSHRWGDFPRDTLELGKHAVHA